MAKVNILCILKEAVCYFIIAFRRVMYQQNTKMVIDFQGIFFIII